jgi:hypothetical protein
MALELSDSFQLLFLDREEPRRLFSPSAARTTSPDSILSTAKKSTVTNEPIHPPVNRSPSNASSNTSATSYKDSNSSSSRQNSVSTRASSISVPNWQPPPTFVQQFMAPQAYNYGYDLPCEFFFLGCDLRFNPADVELWISHSASHFVNAPLPSTTTCTFCDEATFRSHGDAMTNWRERMLHIFDHLAEFTPSEHMRPDFWVIEHMEKFRLISPEDHTHALQGTERPHCDNLYPLGYETPDMLNKKERDSQERHDVRKEDRQRRKEGRNGKSTNTPSSSHRSRKSYNPHIEKKR